MRRAAKLFHAIVVVGTGVAHGCGGKAVVDGGAGGSGAGSPATGATTAGSTATGSSTATGNSTATGSSAATGSSSGTGAGSSSSSGSGAPTKPSDCKTTADFHCQSYQPPTGCKCIPGSCLSDADCQGLLCSCHSYDPPVGCDCFVPIK